jgi:hypothetical protein
MLETIVLQMLLEFAIELPPRRPLSWCGGTDISYTSANPSEDLTIGDIILRGIIVNPGQEADR